jgi:hypothetical protein
MKIDRTLFLQTMASFAVGACGKEAPPPEAPQVLVVNAPPVAPAPASGAEASPVAMRADAGTGGPAIVASPTTLATSKVDTLAALDAFDPNGKHTCAELKCPLGPTAEGMSALVDSCKNLQNNLTAPRFQRFIQCMLKQNNSQNTCDLRIVGTSPGECMEGWANKVDVIPEAAALCAPARKKCDAFRSNAIPDGMCERIVSGVKPAARKKMVACTTEYCNQAGTLCGIY